MCVFVFFCVNFFDAYIYIRTNKYISKYIYVYMNINILTFFYELYIYIYYAYIYFICIPI